MVVIVLVVVTVILLLLISKSFCVVSSGQSVVLERMGNFSKILTPGMHFITPFINNKKVVTWSRTEETRVGTKNSYSKRHFTFSAIPIVEQVHDLPEFRSTTKDRIDVYVNGLVFYRIADVKKAVYNISDLYSAIESLVETGIRDFTSTVTLEELFTSRDKLMAHVISTLNDCEENWGTKITRFEIQEINCSPEVRKATELNVLKMREADAKIIMAEATRKSKLLEVQAENEINQSRQKAEAQLSIENAEKERQLSAINNRRLFEISESEAKCRKVEAEVEAQNLILSYEAEAEGIKKLLAITGIDGEYLRHRNQIQAWASMASNPNNKIVLPYNSVPLLGAQALMQSLANGGEDTE